jgi:predicted deacylase
VTLRADIQASLRGVIADQGETWQYRRLTSGPSANTRTYGSWTNVTAHASDRAAPPEWDAERNVWKRVERLRFRVSDALADLHQGDQVKDPAGTVYALTGISSNAPNTGTIAYDCERAVPLKIEAGSREGGV